VQDHVNPLVAAGLLRPISSSKLTKRSAGNAGAALVGHSRRLRLPYLTANVRLARQRRDVAVEKKGNYMNKEAHTVDPALFGASLEANGKEKT
jgi:hypothetical protein